MKPVYHRNPTPDRKGIEHIREEINRLDKVRDICFVLEMADEKFEQETGRIKDLNGKKLRFYEEHINDLRLDKMSLNKRYIFMDKTLGVDRCF